MSKYINPEQIFGRRYRKGKGGGGGGGIDPQVAALAQQGTFKPFALTTSAGTGFGENGLYGASSTDQFAQAQWDALGGVNSLVPQIADSFGRPADEFSFDSDINKAQESLFKQQASLLQPQFTQQNQQLKNDLFGSGRMGLSLAGSAVGAGGGGFVSPDAFGLSQSQNQTLANVAAQTRQQALGEQQQQFGIDQGVFGTNQALEQQRSQNLLAGSQGLFGLGQGVSQQELELLKAGINAESLRGQSYTNAASALAAGKEPPKQDGGKGLLGSVVGAAGNVGAAGVTSGAWLGSDSRLKDNISKIGQLPNGLGIYTWTWNEIAKGLGINSQEVGVLAQEVLEIKPDAVQLDENGYYKVNYSEALNGTI